MIKEDRFLMFQQGRLICFLSKKDAGDRKDLKGVVGHAREPGTAEQLRLEKRASLSIEATNGDDDVDEDSVGREIR